MDQPDFIVDENSVAAYSRMFDIQLTSEDVEALTVELALVLDDLRRLWVHDVVDHEMAVIFPVRQR